MDMNNLTVGKVEAPREDLWAINRLFYTLERLRFCKIETMLRERVSFNKFMGTFVLWT